MLSEHERRELADIEREIMADDPEMVRRMARRAGDPVPRRWPYTAAVVAAVVLLVLCVVLAKAGLALLMAVITAGAIVTRRWKFGKGSEARDRHERA